MRIFLRMLLVVSCELALCVLVWLLSGSCQITLGVALLITWPVALLTYDWIDPP